MDMSNYRNRPKGKYIQEANWEELYILTQYWKSDLEFYKDDLRFLHHLVDKYIIWITKKENLDMVKEIKLNLYHIRRQCKDLVQKIAEHLIHIGHLVENPEKEDADYFKKEHENLEDDISSFVKRFRANRKEVFSITEYIIDSEELPSILNS